MIREICKSYSEGGDTPMKFAIGNGTKAILCTLVAGIFTFIGGIYTQREQMEKLEEIDREYHENKSTEVDEEEV